jgi:hypothetical protein
MRLLSLLSLLCLFAVNALTAAEDKVVIWKMDDVRAGEKRRLQVGFKRVAEWAKAEKTVVTMGVICDSLAQPNADDVAWIKANAIENGGVVEFWHHGWDHRSWTDAAGQTPQRRAGDLQADHRIDLPRLRRALQPSRRRHHRRHGRRT